MSPTSTRKQPHFATSVPCLTASEQKPLSQIGQVLRSDQAGVPTLSLKKKPLSQVPLQGARTLSSLLCLTQEHIWVSLNPKRQGQSQGPPCPLGIPCHFPPGAAAEHCSQWQSHRGRFSKSCAFLLGV